MTDDLSEVQPSEVQLSEVRMIERFASAEDYCRLRIEAGMSPRTLQAAARGLPGTLFGVSLLLHGETIGMGRIIGDGGCFYTVVDVAVAPQWQGRGLGKRIFDRLDAWLRANAEPSAFVTLVADGDAKHLYAKYGFVESAPYAVNMEYVVGADGGPAPASD
ncbi:MAG: GNAT family N-acetyltransferase [Lysobacter sp.]